MTSGAGLRFSLVIPFYNEEHTIALVLDEVEGLASALGRFELLAVDDGSSDRSLECMQNWKREHGAAWVRILECERNFGQSAAVMAGVEHARGPLILTMDGDMQNDPRDLIRILETLEAGEYQGVVGIRTDRRDNILRRVSSRIGNGVRNLVTGDRIADAGCGIKGFEAEVFRRVPHFDGMHRFMATLARQDGARVVEIPVNHRPRAGGRANYGIGNRAFRGLVDCLAVCWMRKRVLRHVVKEES